MDIATTRDLFIHELSVTLDAEEKIVAALPTMRDEATNPILKEGFARHLVESELQAETLRAILSDVGGQMDPTPSYPSDGIKREHDAFVAEAKTPVMMDMGLAAGALKTEHLEIASYKVLIELATLMHNARYVTLLKESLRQEQSTAEQLELAVAKLLHEQSYMAVFP